jgi:hypothetical protein
MPALEEHVENSTMCHGLELAVFDRFSGQATNRLQASHFQVTVDYVTR